MSGDAKKSMRGRSMPVGRRIAEMLRRKRSVLEEYRLVLAKQREAILADEIGKLSTYTALMASLTRAASGIERTLAPLESLYRSSYPESERDEELEALFSDTLLLQASLRGFIEENRLLLLGRMESVKKELAELRIPRGIRPIYGDGTARAIDLSR
jgi:hypothetical protein